MTTKIIRLVALTLGLAWATLTPASAQSPSGADIGNHGGAVMQGSPDVYFVLYGCWGMTNCPSPQSNDDALLDEFIDQFAEASAGALFYGGDAVDRYSRGPALTEADLAGIVENQIVTSGLPMDPRGIYVIVTTSDVTLADGAAQLCGTCCNLRGHAVVDGENLPYLFAGSPARCPDVCWPNALSFQSDWPAPRGRHPSRPMPIAPSANLGEGQKGSCDIASR
jgi:hypothetical protein